MVRLVDFWVSRFLTLHNVGGSYPVSWRTEERDWGPSKGKNSLLQMVFRLWPNVSSFLGLKNHSLSCKLGLAGPENHLSQNPFICLSFIYLHIPVIHSVLWRVQTKTHDTLLCVKWMTSENLLRSTGNSAHCSAATSAGRKPQREGMCVHV